MCTDLHNGNLSWEDYSRLGDWEFHDKAEKMEQNEGQENFEEETCPQKQWICPGCEHVCKGETFMRKRNYHKKH